MKILNALFLLLLLCCAATPFLLITIGFFRRNKPNGIILYMVGCLLLLSYFPVRLFESCAGFIFLALLYPLYRLYRYIQLNEGKKRGYLVYCLHMIRGAQCGDLPSCEKLLMDHIVNQLVLVKASSIEDTRRTAQISVYRLCLRLFDSPQYRDMWGHPLDTCKQLQCICQNSLDYLLEQGYITQDEHRDSNDYLKQCERYPEKYSTSLYC